MLEVRQQRGLEIAATAKIAKKGGACDDDNRWGASIDNAEAITVFNESPPYNSSRIVSTNVKEPTIVLNHERRHRLPKCLSNLDELID